MTLSKVSEEQACYICQSRFNTQWSPSYEVFLCSFHDLMTGHGIEAMMAVIQNNAALKGAGRFYIEKEFFNAGRWNSYDRDTMLPHFSNELLIEQTEYTFKNCRPLHRPASVYDEALQLYAQTLVDRLREKK